MKETIEHNNRFYGEELKTESEQLKEWLVIANKEIERLNNIIKTFDGYLDTVLYTYRKNKESEANIQLELAKRKLKELQENK